MQRTAREAAKIIDRPREALAAADPTIAAMSTLTLTEGHFRQFLALTKPRVVSLVVFCAVIGMFLAVPGLPPPVPVFFATVGIAPDAPPMTMFCGVAGLSSTV